MAKKKYENEDDTRTIPVNISMSKNEKKAMEDAAKKMGLSNSSYARWKLFYEGKNKEA